MVSARWAFAAAIFTLATAIPAKHAAAQRSIYIGAAASAGIPAGKFSKEYATGPGFLITLASAPSDYPIGFRLDISDHKVNGRSVQGQRLGDIHLSALTLNTVGTLSLGNAKPYLIAGGGWYPFKQSANAKRQSDWGVNAGAGITFPLPIGAGFLETRYHYIFGRSTAQRYIPVSLGFLL